MVAVAEHWLHENQLSLLSQISDKVSICGRSSNAARAENYGTRCGQGGVAILWRKSIGGGGGLVTEISNIIHDRICGIRISTVGGGVVNDFLVYMPAQGCGEDRDTCLDDLAEILSSREQGAINIVCGDFNADMGNRGGSKSKRRHTKQGLSLLNLIEEFGMSAWNLQVYATGPVDTYFGPTGQPTIYYILVPRACEHLVEKCIVKGEELLNTSDHNPVQVTEM